MRILIFRRGRSGSVAMVKAIDIGDGNPENKLPGPPGWGLGVRPITSPQIFKIENIINSNSIGPLVSKMLIF